VRNALIRPPDLRYARSVKRRLLGAALFVPLVISIALAAPTCERGRVMGGGGGYGELWNNVLAACLMASVVAAITGGVLLFGKPPDK
jgi:hypothetical protein